jgi:hypothetical protein
MIAAFPETGKTGRQLKSALVLQCPIADSDHIVHDSFGSLLTPAVRNDKFKVVRQGNMLPSGGGWDMDSRIERKM